MKRSSAARTSASVINPTLSSGRTAGGETMPEPTTHVVLTALAGNGAIAIRKFIAAAVSGSSAMFAEAIHSLVDTGDQVLLLIGQKRSARPAGRVAYVYVRPSRPPVDSAPSHKSEPKEKLSEQR